MPTMILMPALSPTMKEGNLTKWLVKEGDDISVGDVLAEIETDKAVMEFEAVDEGVIAKIMVASGTNQVKVNDVIAVLLEDGEKLPDDFVVPERTKESLSVIQNQDLQNSDKQFDAKADLNKENSNKENSNKTLENNKNKVLEQNLIVESPQAAVELPQAADKIIFASPLAKRLAKNNSIELSQVSGSGPKGRIIKRDIDNYQNRQQRSEENVFPSEKNVFPMSNQEAMSNQEVMSNQVVETNIIRNQTEEKPQGGKPQINKLSGTNLLDPNVYNPENYHLQENSGMRKIIAQRLHQSFNQEVPHFSLLVEVNLDKLLALRKIINQQNAKDNIKISVNDMIIKACAMALIKVPAANASYSDEAIIMHHHADIGVAVALDGGLITPIIWQAESLGLGEISLRMQELVKRAKARKLAPHEFMGGSFSVSNLGMMGIKSFSSIVNQPQGAIISIGAGEKRACVVDDRLTIATLMNATLTCDHRVVDGAVGALFLQHFKSLIEEPGLMLV